MTVLKTILGDRVVIKPLSAEERAGDSPIILPDGSLKQRAVEGHVAALPDPANTMGKPDPNSFLSVGDRVFYDKYSAEDVTYQDATGKIEKGIMVFIDSIYCIVTPIKNA